MSRLKILWVCAALLATVTAAAGRNRDPLPARAAAVPGATARATAAVAEHRDSLLVTLFFRVGETVVDRSYMGNGVRIDDFAGKLSSRTGRVVYAEVGATASPEGVAAQNRVLADRRADAIERLLRELVPDLGVSVVRGAGFEYDWRGLREVVERDPAVPNRPRLLEIIDDRSLDDRGRNLAVRRLDDGRTFEYMKRKMLDVLRTGTILIATAREVPAVPVPEPEPVDVIVGVPPKDGAACTATLPAPSDTVAVPTVTNIKKRHLLALKTNLLFDAVGALNAGVELPAGRHVSVTVDGAYSFWRINNLYALQTIQGGASAKWWFNERRGRFTGWNAGVYAMYCTRYDAQWKDGAQGDGFWSAGVAGGYSLPVSKRLRLEVAAAAGYIRTPEIRTYTRPDEGHLMWRKTMYGVGRVSITKLQLNLVWILGKEDRR